MIDLSLIEPVLAMLGPKAAEYRLTGETTARMGSRCNIQALRDVYATSDGKYVALSTGTQGMAERLLRAVGRADLVDDPRFRTNADRLANREEIEAIVRDFIAARRRRPRPWPSSRRPRSRSARSATRPIWPSTLMCASARCWSTCRTG